MIQGATITSSAFSQSWEGNTRINLEVMTPGCGIPRNMAVLTYDPDTVADASENYSAYTMRCQLAGMEPGMDEREFYSYKYITDGDKR